MNAGAQKWHLLAAGHVHQLPDRGEVFVAPLRRAIGFHVFRKRWRARRPRSHRGGSWRRFRHLRRPSLRGDCGGRPGIELRVPVTSTPTPRQAARRGIVPVSGARQLLSTQAILDVIVIVSVALTLYCRGPWGRGYNLTPGQSPRDAAHAIGHILGIAVERLRCRCEEDGRGERGQQGGELVHDLPP